MHPRPCAPTHPYTRSTACTPLTDPFAAARLLEVLCLLEMAAPFYLLEVAAHLHLLEVAVLHHGVATCWRWRCFITVLPSGVRVPTA